ncbi:hypothetical protein [Salinisphaera sp. PC39]|uniref:hypothetical protein n=1 Tax=Salinisphaera sp. PC39 TaxID=1304156 RepID=UPI003342627C
MKTTRYFDTTRRRPDRVNIRDEWIERAVCHPEHEQIQTDGRIRRWIRIPEMGNRHLRVILLADGETVHNAFFDRGFQP